MKRQRVESFEKVLGEELPIPYREFVMSSEVVSEADLQLESDLDPRVHSVRTIYGFDDGESDDQLDFLYDRIGKVLPRKSIPFASTWGGDMFLLFLTSAGRDGVFFWTHERDPDDDSVYKVADSFSDFLGHLTPTEP